MEFRVLGPITATHDGQPVALGRRRERLMLGVLLLEEGRSVPADRLFELLWGDEAEPADRARLHTAVARLRGLLAPYGVRLVSGPAGYAIEAGDAEVDAHRFVAAVAAARAEPHPGRRADALAAALAQWQGPLLADVADIADGRLADRIGARLRELRLLALDERAEADLAAGRAAAVATYLADVAHDHPTRERLVAGLMTALARTGRSQDALAIYRQVYRHLDEQLGTEPGPELRDLHTRILRHDPAVLGEPAAGEPRRFRMLPRDLPGFVGREGEIKALDAAFATDGPPPIMVVSGAGGTGKTALAVRWAHLAADRYPDGQLHVDLRGFSGTTPVSAHGALAQLIAATGLPVDAIPTDLDAAAALYRSRLDGRRVLVLLDNAASADQVRPLIPAGDGCGVLVTSRNRLDGLTAREGAQQLTLGPLRRAESLAVLRSVVGADRVDTDLDAASDLAGLCDDGPLALRVAAAALAARARGSIAAYCARIRAGNPLDALAIPGDESFAVRTVLRQSYEALDPTARRVLRLLAVPSGEQTGLDAVAALLGTPVSTATALLDTLIDAHLLDEPVPGRFGMHDLVRAYAAERLADGPPGEHDDARQRLLGYYIHMADAARRLTTPAVGAVLARGRRPDGVVLTELDDAAAAWGWLDLEVVNLTAETVTAVDHGPRLAAYLIAEALNGYFWTRRDHARWLTVMSAGDRAARAEGDLLAQSCLALLLGNVHWALTDHDLAAQAFERSLDAARALGDPRGQAEALTDLAGLSRACGRLDAARRFAEMAREQHAESGPDREQGVNALILAWIDMDLGEYASAAGHAGRAVEILRATGTQGGAMQALNVRGDALAELGDVAGARACADEVLAHAVKWGVRLNELSATCLLATVARKEARIADGLRLIERAIELAHFINSPAITGHIYVYRADLHLAAGDLAAAEADYTRAITITEQVTQPHAPILARLGRARVAARRGDIDAARDLARAAADVAATTELRELQRRIATVCADIDAAAAPADEDVPTTAGR